MIEEILYDFNDELVESDDLRLLRSFSKYSHSLKEKFKIMFIKGTLSIRAQDRCGNSIEIDIQ